MYTKPLLISSQSQNLDNVAIIPHPSIIGKDALRVKDSENLPSQRREQFMLEAWGTASACI
jgi:hypothetical protein